MLSALLMFVISAVIIGGIAWALQLVITAVMKLPEPILWVRSLIIGIIWVVAVVAILYALLPVVRSLGGGI